jgi:nitronate monooxygenase
MLSRWFNPLMNHSLERLGVELCVIQAPMAGVQGSALTVAVSNVGGLGSLPFTTLTPKSLRQELIAVQAQTKRAYNVNFFCHTVPHPNPEREAKWRALLLPYYQEYGLDIETISTSMGRRPLSRFP